MATPEVVAEQKELAGINADYKEKFGFHDSETGYAYKSPKGLSRQVVESISEYKSEPQWMRDFRIKAYEHFESRPTPAWGGNLGRADTSVHRRALKEQIAPCARAPAPGKRKPIKIIS